jgi:signal transduction histidine kinase
VNSPRALFVSVHRRILLVFLISIALPGSYLGYVGLRSIVQERELQQGLLVQNVARSLGFEIDKLEQRLADSEEHLAKELLVSKNARVSSARDTVSALPGWIEQGVVFDSHLHLRNPFPFASEQGMRRLSSTKEPLLQGKIESAERLELRGDRRAALSAYRKLLAEDHTLQGRVILNTYIARCAQAIGNHTAARQAYEAIIRSDSTFLIAQPIPYAAFAWLEILDELVKQGKTSEALHASLEFRRHLLSFYYRLSSEQYEYFSHKLLSLNGIFERASDRDARVWAALRSVEEQGRLLSHTLSRAQEIESWLQTQRSVLSVQDYAGKISHHSVRLGEQSLPVSLIQVNDPPSPRSWVVLVLRPEEVRREFILSGLQSGNLADGFEIALRSDSLRPAGGTELARSTMHKTLPLFPSTLVSVSAGQASTVEFLGVRTSFLSTAFGLLLVGVVIFGIFILYHDIRREEELSRMKSEFISNVSHELKTPIAAIRMLSDNLRQSRVDEETRKMEYYQLISKESARLSHLIDNILDFSRVEGKRKRFQLERHDVSTIVTETVHQFTSLMEEQSHTIETSFGETIPEVLVDSDGLALALFNLLDNAAKYSPKESQIDVRVYKNGGSVCIEVSDRGVGIPKEDREKIFEKFYRVERHDTRRIPGSGIGLTLVREVAEAHKGRVELRSEQGAGSTFTIMLPTGG